MSHLLAHPKTKADLEVIVADPRACYMLVGAPRSGRLASALFVTTRLHCGGQEGCTGCKRIIAGTDPDVLRLTPNEKGAITIEMAHGLVDSLGKHPSRAGATRVVIVEAAERMTIPAQNALLKVIEEPPANTVILLLVGSLNGVLSTIKSRCQAIYIRSVSVKQIQEFGASQFIETARGRAGLIMDMMSLPEQNDIIFDIISRADEIMSASSFQRMVLVDKLTADKNQAEIIEWVAYKVSQALRTQNASSQALQSMQNYFIYSSAGVANKHALMEMMIRL